MSRSGNKGNIILVANLGSTSFKYRLFDMDSETQLARGSVERIGSPTSRCEVRIGDTHQELETEIPDHGVALRQCLEQLTDSVHGCLSDAREVSAIGFKAVHGGRLSDVQQINDDVLSAMEEMKDVAPAHNPPYIAAIRRLADQYRDTPLVAAFETGFHNTIPDRLRSYAIEPEWAEQHYVRRWGFHGASHRYISQRTAELFGRNNLRIVSCHLGGSSSLCAIRHGQSVATTMGMSPQSGLPQNNRVGDFDPFALPWLMARTGLSLQQVLDRLANQSGLLGLSGTSGDIRDLEQAAAGGNDQAQLALDVYVTEIRRHLGGLLVELGGADVIVFTGGIGEHGEQIRAAVCRDLASFGIALNSESNQHARGETRIDAADSKTQIWIIPTNEELVVARQTAALLKG